MNNQTNNTTSIIQGTSERGIINQLTVVINFREIPGLRQLQQQKKADFEQGIKDLLNTYFAPGKITTNKVFNQNEIVVKLPTSCTS